MLRSHPASGLLLGAVHTLSAETVHETTEHTVLVSQYIHTAAGRNLEGSLQMI